MHEIIWTVQAADTGEKLKTVITRRMQVSHKAYARAKFDGGVFLDGIRATANELVAEGQVIRLCLRETPSYLPKPFQTHIPVLYEDEDLYVADKPAPMACQAGIHPVADSLENAMFERFGRPPGFIFRPVNRLDKGTSGVMVIAKTGHAHALLQRQLHTPGYVRTYLAVTEGLPPEAEGTIRLPIGRAEGSIVKREVRPDGRDAITHYTVLSQSGGRALCRLQLQTGRTHQIRVHLSALHCPVAGDFLYGTELDMLPGRFALHSEEVAFAHPISGRQIRIGSPLPEPLRALLEEAL